MASGPARIGRIGRAAGCITVAATGFTAAAHSEAASPHVEAAKDRIMAARESNRLTLFPEIEPYASGFITSTTASGTVHRIFYEECGNPEGKPVVFVHGGPGGGIGPTYRRFHDPKAYRIILFDQRGCGQSTPHASLDENTTWHLIDDMERLRTKLGIDTWQVFGGSWGSTLALAYAEMHPLRVSELVLRGIFTLRRKELAFYYQSGANWLFPDQWEAYLKPIPESERHDLVTAYRKRLVGEDDEARIEAARAWTQWENCTSNLFPKGSDEVKGDGDAFALAFARIENHFFHNGGFWEWDDWLLDNVHKIAHIPTAIIQGRYDVVCPTKTAWELHKAMKAAGSDASLVIVPDSGHSCMEPGTLDELIRATERFKHR